jgi:hypothetical protein
MELFDVVSIVSVVFGRARNPSCWYWGYSKEDGDEGTVDHGRFTLKETK